MLSRDDQKAIRDIRFQIGRLRRRVDRRLNQARRDGRRLTSWRTYATTFPGSVFTTAFGAGLALALGLSGKRIFRVVGMRIFRRGMKGIGDGVKKEIEKEVVRFWEERKNKKV
ncbi:MAG: hypothetical protein PVH19_08315 [Planctomycetia bacterium]|jgi:hypothetical protein